MPNYFSIPTNVEDFGTVQNDENFLYRYHAVKKLQENSKAQKVFRPASNPYKLGEEGSDTRELGGVQDFDELKFKYSSKNLFVDTEFPAFDFSIVPPEMRSRFSKEWLERHIGTCEWLRPKEIESRRNCTRSTIENRPQFFVNGSARSDVRHQVLGNCWLLASLATVAEDPDLLSQAVPQCREYLKDCCDAIKSGNNVEAPDCRVFDEENYSGIFHFIFFEGGSWVDVVIDDLLPTIDGELVFAKSSTENEYWCALAEKAYAKLRGSYGALHRGRCVDALEALTGGRCLSYKSNQPESHLEKRLIEAQNLKALITFSSNEDETGIQPESAESSIVGSHYVCSLTKFFPEENEKWLKLRNPLGYGESIGKGCDDDIKKSDIETQIRMGFKEGDDSEFFMRLEEVKKYFDHIDICYYKKTAGSFETQSPREYNKKMGFEKSISWKVGL